VDNAAVILETVKKVRTKVINFYRHLIINQTENKENHQRFYFPDVFHWQIEEYFTKFFSRIFIPSLNAREESRELDASAKR